MIIKRHDLFKEFKEKWSGLLPERDLITIFKTTSDEELIQNTGLRILRKGYFIT